MGMIRFPAFATWWADALHELLTFDAGLHDDFIAALSEIGMGLQRITKPSKQVAVAPSTLPHHGDPRSNGLKRMNANKPARLRLGN